MLNDNQIINYRNLFSFSFLHYQSRNALCE